MKARVKVQVTHLDPPQWEQPFRCIICGEDFQQRIAGRALLTFQGTGAGQAAVCPTCIRAGRAGAIARGYDCLLAATDPFIRDFRQLILKALEEETEWPPPLLLETVEGEAAAVEEARAAAGELAHFNAYFGTCPECGQGTGYLNVGRDHWFYCDEHKTRWWAGSNLFSSWREEDEETWQANKTKLADYTEVHRPQVE